MGEAVKMIKIILEFPSLQTILTALLVGATIWYARLTYKMLHAPYKSILIPLNFDLNDNGAWEFKIRNCGPGIAKSVELVGIIQKNIEFQDIKKPDKMWAEVSYDPASGPFLLMPNNDGLYVFRGVLLALESPFLIRWKTILDKTQKSYWVIKIHNGDRIRFDQFTSLSFTGLNTFRIKRIKILICSPYHAAHRRLSLWSRNRRKSGVISHG